MRRAVACRSTRRTDAPRRAARRRKVVRVKHGRSSCFRYSTAVSATRERPQTCERALGRTYMAALDWMRSKRLLTRLRVVLVDRVCAFRRVLRKPVKYVLGVSTASMETAWSGVEASADCCGSRTKRAGGRSRFMLSASREAPRESNCAARVRSRRYPNPSSDGTHRALQARKQRAIDRS